MAARAAFGWDGPAESAGAAGKLLRRGELGDGGALEDAIVSVDAAVEEHLAERGEVWRCAEDTRVAGDAADAEGVFVVNSVGAIQDQRVFGGRYIESFMPSGLKM